MNILILILSSSFFYHPSAEVHSKDVLFTKQEMIKDFNLNIHKTNLDENENSRTIKLVHSFWDKNLVDN